MHLVREYLAREVADSERWAKQERQSNEFSGESNDFFSGSYNKMSTVNMELNKLLNLLSPNEAE